MTNEALKKNIDIDIEIESLDCPTIHVNHFTQDQSYKVALIPEVFLKCFLTLKPKCIWKIAESHFDIKNYKTFQLFDIVNPQHFYSLMTKDDIYKNPGSKNFHSYSMYNSGVVFCFVENSTLYYTYGYDYKMWFDYAKAILKYKRSSYYIHPFESEAIYKHYINIFQCEVTKSNDSFTKFYIGSEKLGLTNIQDFDELCSLQYADGRSDLNTFGVKYKINEYLKMKKWSSENFTRQNFEDINKFGFDTYQNFKNFNNSNFFFGQNVYEFKKYFEFNTLSEMNRKPKIEDLDENLKEKILIFLYLKDFINYVKKINLIYIKAKDEGFANFFDYIISTELEINEFEEYDKFKKKFPLTEFPLHIVDRPTLNKSRLGIKYENYSRVVDYIEPDFSMLRQRYKEYKANIKGFNCLKDMENADELSFENAAQYYAFKESGCESKEEFVELLNKIPKKIKKLKEIEINAFNKANSAFQSKDSSGYAHYAYTTLEKKAERLKWSLFPGLSDLNTDEVLEIPLGKIGEYLNLELPKSDEITYWRRKRNDIVHNALDLDYNEAQEAKKFFDGLFKILDNAFPVKK